jgi:hypothetical protein
MAVLVTVARERWPDLFEGLIDQLADCFPRRETRMTCRNMIEAMLTVEETANLLDPRRGDRSPRPTRAAAFLVRTRWHDDVVRDRVATWAVDQLGDLNVVLVVDETGMRSPSPTPSPTPGSPAD